MEFNIEPEESDIILDIKVPEEKTKEVSESLQRTKEWHAQRNGNWNGSQRKQLMSCSNKGGRLSWHNKEKVFMFSEGAIKTIYAKAMERRKGRGIIGSSTKQMSYGTAVEVLMAEIARKKYIEIDPTLVLEQVGYRASEETENAGASSDGLFTRNGVPYASVEQKACCSWESHYDRTFEPTDEKSIDFWQSQAQMEAWNVERTIYVVAEPPEDINVYLKAGDILEYQEHFEEECKVTFEEIMRSPIHQAAMSIRIKIAEEVIKRWNSSGGRLKDIFYEVVDEFKTKENEEPVYVEKTDIFEEFLPSKENEIIEALVEIAKNPEPEIDYEDLPF